MSQHLSERKATAYYSGNIFTAATGNPRAEAFIVSPNGTFTAVGSNDEILKMARRDTLPTVDLQSRFVMPGIHDAHVHILLAGLSASASAKLGMDTTVSNVGERLKSPACVCADAHAYGDWIVGDLFRIENFDRTALDKDFPETPVLLRGGGGHAMFLNTAALKRSGYSLDEADSPHSYYFRRPDGTLTGEMAELGMTKAALALPKPGMADLKRIVSQALGRLRAAGVTSFQEAASNTTILKALGQLDADGELKMDVQAHIVYKPEQLAEERFETLHKTLDDSASFQTAHLQTNFVKLMLDGVPFYPYLTQASLNAAGDIDESKIQIDDLAEAVAKFDARGMTCKIHCAGQGSTRRALDVYEMARRSNPTGPKHEVAHCNAVHDDDFARFRKLNVTAEMSPSMFFVHPATAASQGLMDWNWAKMIKHAAHLTIGSDWTFDDPDLLPPCALILDCVAAAVMPSSDDASAKRQAAGETICRMLTIAGAEATGRAATTGSIEVGKKACFISVDKDLSRGDFDGAKVLGTWFEGEKVWDAAH